MPVMVPQKYLDHWRRPWTRKAKYSPGFRLWLHSKGRLSPHFTYEEAKCRDGTHIPRRLRSQARNHAFNLERLRHELGDNPVRIISWYRTPAYNRSVGGASKSKHMDAVATDHPVQWVRQFPHFDQIADRIFANGGFGAYPGGARHLDSRGYKARWTSWVRST